MSGANRRGLLKGALAGSVSIIGAQAGLGFPDAGSQGEMENSPAITASGCPGGPASSIQYRAGGCTLGGIANFKLSSLGVVNVGPMEAEIPGGSTTVPRLQLSTSGNFFQIGTNVVGSRAAMAFVDNSTTASNATDAEDGFIISRNYMPSRKAATNFGFSGMTIGLSNDPSNTQDQSGAYLAGLNVYTKLLSPTAVGNTSGIDVLNRSTVAPGQTQTVASFIGLYTETLLGDGVNVAVYNVAKAIGLSIGTTGFHGPQAGTITTSWGLNIEGPRLGTGTGTFSSRMGIRIASQAQGNPGGRNPNSWAIHEDDPADRNALGSINLGGDSGPLISTGTGDPNGVVTSVVGGIYLRLDGGAGSTLYVKESGSGNTGWVAK